MNFTLNLEHVGHDMHIILNVKGFSTHPHLEDMYKIIILDIFSAMLRFCLASVQSFYFYVCGTYCSIFP